MRLLLQHNDHIPGNDTGGLVSLAGKGDPLPVLHALVNVHLKDLALALGLLAFALLAAILLLDGLALTVAILADLLNLLHHAGTNLPQTNGDTLAITGVAGLR